MLTGKLLASSIKYKTINNEKNNKKNKENVVNFNSLQKEKENPFFYPKEKDTLFWCFFIIQNGFSKYEYPGTTTFVNEKAEKFKCIDLLRKNKQQLKTNKIKNIKEDVEDELANKQTINMKTFIALCVASNINIMYIHKRKCFEYIFDEEMPIHVVHCIDNTGLSSKYCYEINITKEKIENYRNTLFKWDNIDKPLKAVSSYKLEELIELSKKFGLGDDDKEFHKKTKKELYEKLVIQL